MKTSPLVLLLAFAFSADAASKYVLAGASGANNGTSWADAWDSLTNIVWTRGDTVFIAGGNYTNALTIACAESGDLFVSLKKANEADNGSDIGWSAEFATQVAFINGTLAIQNSFVSIDGVTGGARSGYGIQLYQASGESGNAIANMTSGTSSLSVSHVEFVGPGWGYSNGVSAFKLNTIGSVSSNISVSSCWARGFSQNAFVFSNVSGDSWSNYGLLFDGVIIDDCGYNTSGAHGQAIQGGSGAAGSVQSFWKVCNSIFYNCKGTADIAFLGYSTNSDILIYNNVFHNTNHSVAGDGVWTNYTASLDASSPGVIYVSSTSASSTRVKVINNTFYKIARNTVYFGDTVTNGNVFANNLVIDGRYNILNVGVFGSHDDYYLCEPVISSGIYGVPYGEEGQQTESQMPVVGAASGDFRLVDGANAIGGGLDFSDLFTADFTGSTRVAPWDIGAYEYLGRRAAAGTVNVGTLIIAP